MGRENEYITLHDYFGESKSTVSPEVNNFLMKNKKATLKEEIKIPELSMRQICERYFLRHVDFLVVDVEGYGYKVL